CSSLWRVSVSQPPVTRRPVTAFSLLAWAASVTLFSVSGQEVSFPSHVKSRPSAPALSAASALLTSAVASSMTIAAALGFVSCLFFPKKPIPLPPCALRACANMSSSLLIFFCNSLLFYITFASFVRRVRDVSHLLLYLFRALRLHERKLSPVISSVSPAASSASASATRF